MRTLHEWTAHPRQNPSEYALCRGCGVVLGSLGYERRDKGEPCPGKQAGAKLPSSHDEIMAITHEIAGRARRMGWE